MERKTADEYPQELLDLFHEYQHGDIDRRSFLSGITKFAVGGLTVAAIFESLKPNYAWAQTVQKDDKDLKTGYETVPSPQGNGSIKGYLARPAKGKKFPTVLVIHENRGLNPYIEDVARRLAKAGYMAFAPDGLTSVGGYPGDDEKGAEAFRKVDGKKMTEDFVAAALWLKQRKDGKGKLGAVGFCFGGGMVNQLAVRLGKDLNAGADDKQHEERIQKVLCPQPERKTCCDGRRGGIPRVAADKFLHGGKSTQLLCRRNRDNQEYNPNWDNP